MSIGVPIKVLHEAEGHIVTCETNTGEVYRGKLIEAEDNMNCQVAVRFPLSGHQCPGPESRQVVTGGLRDAVPMSRGLSSVPCVLGAVLQVHRVGRDQSPVGFWKSQLCPSFSPLVWGPASEKALLPSVGVPPRMGRYPFAATGLHSALQLTESSIHMPCLFAVFLGDMSLV